MCIRPVHETAQGVDISFSEYLCRLTHPITDNVFEYKIHRMSPALRKRILCVNVPCTASALDSFSLTPEQRQPLINQGATAMRHWFNHDIYFVIDIFTALVQSYAW